MKLRILATSDIHGKLFNYRYDGCIPHELIFTHNDMGLISLESEMKKYRAEHTIKIDNGDAIEGSPFLTHFYQEEKGENPMALALNICQYDYFNIGNHDLNYGGEVLANYIHNNKAQCLTGNLFYQGKRIGNEYTLITIENKTIALIGVITHYIKNWEKKQYLEDFDVLDAFEYVQKTLNKIKHKEKVDGIVVVYHGGFEKDQDGNPEESLTGENQGYRMCTEIDGIDLLISGHQHRTLAHKIKNTVVIQMGSEGQSFGKIDWDFDNHNIEAEIILNRGVYDQDLYYAFASKEAEVQKWLDEPIGRLKGDNLAIKFSFLARAHKSPYISFINQVLRAKSGSDLAAFSLFYDIPGFEREIITRRDILCNFPFVTHMVTLEVDGKFLRQYLEKAASYFAIDDGELVVSNAYYTPRFQPYNYDMVDGIDYTFDIRNDVGNRVISILYQGNEVKGDDLFTLTVNNNRAAGGGGYDMFRDAKIIKEDNINIDEEVIAYLKENDPAYVDHHDNIHIIY